MKKLSVFILAAGALLFLKPVQRYIRETPGKHSHQQQPGYYPDSLVVTKMLLYGPDMPSCSH